MTRSSVVLTAVDRFQPISISTRPLWSFSVTLSSSFTSDAGDRWSVRSPDSRLTSPRLSPTASDVRYSAVSSGDAMRANSKLFLPMVISSGLVVIVVIVVIVRGAFPDDGDLDLGLALLFARLDLHRQVAVRMDSDLLLTHGER